MASAEATASLSQHTAHHNYFSDPASISQTCGRKRAILMLVGGFIRRLKKKTLRNHTIPSSIITLLFRFIYDQNLPNYYDPNKKQKKKEITIFIAGLDAAGTTMILYQFKLGEVVNTIPTIGFNVETIEYKGKEITMWDARGCSKVRPMWHHWYEV